MKLRRVWAEKIARYPTHFVLSMTALAIAIAHLAGILVGAW